MATIQIRDVPDDVLGHFRQQARASGQSLQAYMPEWAVQLVDRASFGTSLIEIELMQYRRSVGVA